MKQTQELNLSSSEIRLIHAFRGTSDVFQRMTLTFVENAAHAPKMKRRADDRPVLTMIDGGAK